MSDNEEEYILSNEEKRWAQDLVENDLYFRRELYDKIKDPRRDLYADCGYTKTSEITPEGLLDMYQRFPIATRVVDLAVDESWRKTPNVEELQDSDNETEFEKEWRLLDSELSGEKSWFKSEEGSPIWEYLKRIDRMSRIGQYGVLLLEFNDIEGVTDDKKESKTWRDPAPGFEEADTKGYLTYNAEERQKKKGVQLIGLRTFDQAHAEISEWNDDESSPMFGKPLRYKITLGDQETSSRDIVKGLRERQVDVHWSRVIHVAENLSNGEYIGSPVCRPVLNDLMDLQKLYAASGEGYWRVAFPGLSFESHPTLGGKANLNAGNIKKQLQAYQNTLQRVIATSGGTIKTVSGTIAQLGDHVESRIESICIYLGCPVRIFKGSERGELASSQDKDSWDERMTLRQENYITPRIIAPFVNRLIAVGVLPEPKEGFSVDWPDLTALSLMAKAELAGKVTEAMAKYAGGGVDTLIAPEDFFVHVLDYDQETTEEILKAAVEHINAVNPEEDDVDEPGRNPKPAMPDFIPGQEEEGVIEDGKSKDPKKVSPIPGKPENDSKKPIMSPKKSVK